MAHPTTSIAVAAEPDAPPMTPQQVWERLTQGMEAWSVEDAPGVTNAWAPLGHDAAIRAVSIAGLLDLAALALRLQATKPNAPWYEMDDLLAHMGDAGVIRPSDLPAFSRLVSHAAAIAGGIRPPIQPLLDAYPESNLLELSGVVLTLTLSSLSSSTGRTPPRVVRDVRAAARAHRLEPSAADTWPPT